MFRGYLRASETDFLGEGKRPWDLPTRVFWGARPDLRASETDFLGEGKRLWDFQTFTSETDFLVEGPILPGNYTKKSRTIDPPFCDIAAQ